jgi:hypothetical protein
MLTKNFKILFLSGFLILMAACDKDENSGKSVYRIKECLVYEDGLQEARLIYHYNGDEISTVNYFDQDSSSEYARHEFNYNGDSVGVDRYFLFNDTLGLLSRESYIYESQHLVRRNLYGAINGVWFLDDKVEYVYSGDNLINESWQHYSSGTWYVDAEFEYDYENGLLKTARLFTSELGWNEMLYEVVEYQENKIKYITRFIAPEFDTATSFRYEYVYSSDKPTRVDYLDFDNGYVPVGGVDFEYDSHNNLVSTTKTLNGKVSTEKYIYEKGSGNYGQLITPVHAIISEIDFPHPTKGLPGPKQFPLINKKIEIRK